MWTLDQLTAIVAAALGRLRILQPNGQVAEAPNGRTVRWYQSIGLLAKPEQRGRVAFYGPSHLRQLVAIKRLQAQGMPLAQVQHALLGRTDLDIAAIADVPAELEVEAPVRFWAVDIPLPDEPATRVAFDHPSGVTLIVPGLAASRVHDVQAILSDVVAALTARGLLAPDQESS